MRILAVIANLAQVGIVLAIFIQSGVQLGGWAVIGLFCLLIIALLNQVVAFYYAANKPVNHPLIGADHSLKAREDLRVTYTTAPQPTVIIDDKPFNVLDLAENGMRFSVGRRDGLHKQVSGRISLLSGQTLAFKGTVVRRHADQAAVAFSEPIEAQLLVKEKRLLQGLA